jgi:hypothetical protein
MICSPPMAQRAAFSFTEGERHEGSSPMSFAVFTILVLSVLVLLVLIYLLVWRWLR